MPKLSNFSGAGFQLKEKTVKLLNCYEYLVRYRRQNFLLRYHSILSIFENVGRDNFQEFLFKLWQL